MAKRFPAQYFGLQNEVRILKPVKNREYTAEFEFLRMGSRAEENFAMEMRKEI